MEDDYDELDDVIMQKQSKGESVKKEHDMLNKAASHPLRRKIVKTIGAFGINTDELPANIDEEPSVLKYHIDFLLNGELVRIENDEYRLTDKGIELLSDCQSGKSNPKC